MPEIDYTQVFFFFYRLFMEVGPWLIFGTLAGGAIYVFGWGSGYATRAKEEIKNPIGKILEAQVTDKGLFITGELSKTEKENSWQKN